MAREKFPSDEIDRMMVRFPSGMRDRLKAEAEANKRSMNAEIVARLEATLEAPQDDITGDPIGDKKSVIFKLLNNLSSKYDRLADSLEKRADQIDEENRMLIEEIKRVNAENRLK